MKAEWKMTKIDDKDNNPVIEVSYFFILAACEWRYPSQLLRHWVMIVIIFRQNNRDNH
ncbi:MAG: hypothetical protein ACLTCI_02345 [[Clostridium] nexile]